MSRNLLHMCYWPSHLRLQHSPRTQAFWRCAPASPSHILRAGEDYTAKKFCTSAPLHKRDEQRSGKERFGRAQSDQDRAFASVTDREMSRLWSKVQHTRNTAQGSASKSRQLRRLQADMEDISSGKKLYDDFNLYRSAMEQLINIPSNDDERFRKLMRQRTVDATLRALRDSEWQQFLA